jgi:hypothetical protein
MKRAIAPGVGKNGNRTNVPGVGSGHMAPLAEDSAMAGAMETCRALHGDLENQLDRRFLF